MRTHFYTYSDLDALGVVLGALAMSDKAKKIIVVSKKVISFNSLLKQVQKSTKSFLKQVNLEPTY
jgi:hypothetical protein